MQKGDRRAAEALYGELSAKVFGFCMNRVGKREIAEDLTQDIFLKLVSHIESFDSARGDFTVWFWQLSRNVVIDFYRRTKELTFSDIGDGENIAELAIFDPRKNFEAKNTADIARTFIVTLTEEEQELFRLRFVADLPYGDIANMTGKSEGSLRVATSRIRKKVKDYFDQDVDDA